MSIQPLDLVLHGPDGPYDLAEDHGEGYTLEELDEVEEAQEALEELLKATERKLYELSEKTALSEHRLQKEWNAGLAALRQAFKGLGETLDDFRGIVEDNVERPVDDDEGESDDERAERIDKDPNGD